MVGCQEKPVSDHYFVDGYPELMFVNKQGDPVPVHFFVRNMNVNGSHMYEVRDTTLRLMNRLSGEMYTGFVNTYHWNIYNIQARFKDGKILFFKFWHPNRTLGMHEDFEVGVGEVWNINGQRSLYWNSNERIYFNPTTQRPREIREGNRISYFNFGGNMTYYRELTDSTNNTYYPNGSPRTAYPSSTEDTSLVLTWHPNGQLKTRGYFFEWEQVGEWVEYDSLGNVKTRLNYN